MSNIGKKTNTEPAAEWAMLQGWSQLNTMRVINLERPGEQYLCARLAADPACGKYNLAVETPVTAC